MKKLILLLALGLELAACASETRVLVVTATPVPPTVTPAPPTATPIPPTITPEPWDATVSALSTGLRQLPDNLSQVIATLPGGTTVDLLAITEDRGWVQVTAYLEGDSAIEGWLQVDKLRLNVSLDDLEVVTETASSPEGDQPTATAAPEPTPLGGGGKIAFSSNRDGDFEIYLMNSDGTNPMRLTNQSTNDFSPEFSPNGDMLLYFAADFSSDPPSGEFRFLGIDGTPMGTFVAFGWGPSSWSPDGKTIALTIGTGEGNMEVLISEIGGTAQLLTSNPAPDHSPAWSPDGKTLAFVSHRDGLPKIYLMDASGDNVRMLTESDKVGLEPSWSPDGTKIAFVSGDNVNTQIYIMNSDGTEVTQVTEGPGFNETPNWSPDGTMLVFWSNRSGNSQIYTIRTDGTELTRLTSNAFIDERPDWAH